MRIIATFIVLAGLTGGAQASSIVMLGSATDAAGPSVIVLGAQAKPARASVVELVAADGYMPQRPSIVAFGEPVPGIDDAEVAAIPDEKAKPRSHAQSPMVIRGGIAGDAFTRANVAPQEEPAATEPQATQDPTIGLAPPPDEAPAAEAEPPDGPVLR